MKSLKFQIVWYIIIFIIGVFDHVCLGEKIQPGKIIPNQETKAFSLKEGKAELQKITEWYEAVGTIRPRTETSIEAQVTAQVLDVKVRPGNKVQKGQVLIALDNRQVSSRLDQARQGVKSATAVREQAKQAVVAAKAALNQAEADYQRIKKFYQAQAATAQNLEQAESAYLQAKANLKSAEEASVAAEAGIRQAQEAIREAEIALGFSTIRAPEDGEVLKRLVEPGDLAVPGKPLLILQTAGTLRLEAYVREGLISKVTPGSEFQVMIGTNGKTFPAKVEEIVPYADPQSRTFLVKASLPQIEGIYPGMFGKLLIPVQELEVVMIPETAIRRVGQLELVQVKINNQWKTRMVKTGQKIGEKVEILSGLSGNEMIGIKESE